MLETSKKQKGLIAGAVGLLVAIEVAAIWTERVEAALPTWLSWLPVVHQMLRSPLPVWLFWGVIVYCASALFIPALTELLGRYKRGKSAALAEITAFTHEAQDIIEEVKHYYGKTGGGEGKRNSRSLLQAIYELQDSLVRAIHFKKRPDLFHITKRIEDAVRADPSAQEWDDIQPHVAKLEQWVIFAERNLLRGSSVLRDPLH